MGVQVGLLSEPAVTDKTGEGFFAGVLRVLHMSGQVPARWKLPQAVVTTGDPVAGSRVHADVPCHG